MKLPVSKGKYTLDKDQLKELFLYIYEKGLQNGILIESGIGTDRSEEECGLFLMSQPDTKVKRIVQKSENKVDLSIPIEERKTNFGKRLKEFEPKYGREMLRAFYRWWSEHNEGGKKMKFEHQKTFNIELRLETWKENDEKRSQSKKQVKETVTNRYKQAYERNQEIRSGGYGSVTGESGVVDEIATEV